jgi:hypothetical protein
MEHLAKYVVNRFASEMSRFLAASGKLALLGQVCIALEFSEHKCQSKAD